MLLYKKLHQHFSEYNIELLSLENWDKTDGRPVSKYDCIDTIKYCPNGFTKEKCYCIGFSLNGEAAAIL